MKNRQYELPTGQTIVSPVDLTYALNADLTIDLQKIHAADFRRISILADEKIADVVTELTDGKQWRDPALAMAQPSEASLSRTKNFCLIQGGTIYIRDGRKYVKLENRIENTTLDELAIITRQLAMQAAVCQAALAGLEKISDTTKAV